MNKVLGVIALLALAVGMAHAQSPGTLTFTAQNTVGNGSVTPVLTWATTPAATQCVASGDWVGTRNPSGTQTLAPITSSKTYNLTCNWGLQKVTVSWSAPTQNTDGSALTDLKGYKIFYGTSPTALNTTLELNTPSLTSAQVTPTSAGTYHFSMVAVNSLDVESARTAPVSAVVAATNTSKSVGITVNPVPNPPSGVTATAQ